MEAEFKLKVQNIKPFPVRVRIHKGRSVFAEQYLKPYSNKGDAHTFIFEGHMSRLYVSVVDARRAKPSKW